VPRARLGNGRRPCERAGDRRARRARAPRRPHRRGAVRARAADRSAAGAAARRARRGRRRARVAQSNPRHARRLLRAPGAGVVKAISAIAVNVFRESVRDKVLYNLVVFAVLLIAASYMLGQLTAGQDVKIIKDLGLAATSLFGLFIAVFIGIGLV